MYSLENQGFGKSTITNKILGLKIAETGDISKKNKRGKNTTTDISIYEVEKDTFLLDTPGFQTIDIEEIESKELDKLFPEFTKHIERCEFVRVYSYKRRKMRCERCIREAEKFGKSRYENYIKIYNKLKYEEENKW